MKDENFSVSNFGLKDEEYTVAFACLMGMLKAKFEGGKKTFTKEEVKKMVEEAVIYAKN